MKRSRGDANRRRRAFLPFVFFLILVLLHLDFGFAFFLLLILLVLLVLLFVLVGEGDALRHDDRSVRRERSRLGGSNHRLGEGDDAIGGGGSSRERRHFVLPRVDVDVHVRSAEHQDGRDATSGRRSKLRGAVEDVPALERVQRDNRGDVRGCQVPIRILRDVRYRLRRARDRLQSSLFAHDGRDATYGDAVAAVGASPAGGECRRRQQRAPSSQTSAARGGAVHRHAKPGEGGVHIRPKAVAVPRARDGRARGPAPPLDNLTIAEPRRAVFAIREIHREPGVG